VFVEATWDQLYSWMDVFVRITVMWGVGQLQFTVMCVSMPACGSTPLDGTFWALYVDHCCYYQFHQRMLLT
jgi:hypothetical protein